jgi:hypothetical protein
MAEVMDSRPRFEFESLYSCTPCTGEAILMRWFPVLVEKNLIVYQGPHLAGFVESRYQQPMNRDLFAPALFCLT